MTRQRSFETRRQWQLAREGASFAALAVLATLATMPVATISAPAAFARRRDAIALTRRFAGAPAVDAAIACGHRRGCVSRIGTRRPRRPPIGRARWF